MSAVENYIFNLYSCAAFFISVVTSGLTSVISMSLLQRITFLTLQLCGILQLHLGICHFNVFAVENTFLTYTVAFFILHLGICHFNVFAVENYIFNLYSCAAFFISWLHLGICHFNVFAVENYIFNLYSCVAFFISVVTSGHLSFQCLCCRELHF